VHSVEILKTKVTLVVVALGGNLSQVEKLIAG